MARKVALAFQGGGVHAAFAWGVADSLLSAAADGKIVIAGASGASSGALNAAALAYGMHEGARLPGPAGARAKRMAQAARAKMEQLWASLARAAFWGGNPLVAATALNNGWNIDETPAARWADFTGAGVTPGESGIGVYLNGVLRDVFPDLPAIFALPDKDAPVVMVSATDVRECRRALFVDGAVSPAVLKAGLCRPADQRTENVGGVHYWDGGFMGNPPLIPLIDRVRDKGCDDVILISTTPLHRDLPPRTPRQIMDRLSEIAFSAAMVHEVNAVETLNRLIDDGKLVKNSGLRRLNLHRIDGDADLKNLGIYSKDAPAWDFLVHLRDLGRAAFERAWPDIQAALGERSSWDSSGLCDQVAARGALA